MERQGGREPDRLAADAANDLERLWLTPEPVSGNLRRFGSLVAAHRLDDRRVVGGGRCFGVDSAQRPVVVVLGADRIRPVEIELVEEGLLLRAAARRAEAIPDMRHQPPVQLPVSLAIAPAEIGVDRFPCDIVGKETLRTLLDEREPAQPFEQLVRVAAGNRGAEQRFGRHPRAGAELEGLSVQGARRACDDPLHERVHDVGRALRAECHVRTVRGDDIRHEDQRQWMTVRELEHGVLLRLGHAPLLEKRPALVGPQVAQWEHTHERSPAKVRRPF